MREEFLHFVWKNKKFKTEKLCTSTAVPVTVLNLGQHNQLSGPDFFNAKLEIGGQVWAGNVEIHLKSSDWYTHGHEDDANYDNVILHVVWQEDVSVYHKDGSEIPTLRLKDFVAEELVLSHQKLMQKKNFINCGTEFSSIDEFTMDNWLERLFVERLEQKSQLIEALLEASKNDWEKVLFCLLMKNFGLNHNGEVFLEMAKVIDFSVFRKVRNDLVKSEALLFGMAGLLEQDGEDAYYLELKKEFGFLSQKFKVKAGFLSKPNFYGLRPNNFPTIRLSQFASLYEQQENLLQKIVKAESMEQISSYFNVAASAYWDTHYVFGKESTKRKKKLTQSFVDLVVVNTLIPLKFCYGIKKGKPIGEVLFKLAQALGAEKNSIIQRFDGMGSPTKNAYESQAKLQLYTNYCLKDHCLKCVVGNKLLLRNG